MWILKDDKSALTVSVCPVLFVYVIDIVSDSPVKREKEATKVVIEDIECTEFPGQVDVIMQGIKVRKLPQDVDV